MKHKIGSNQHKTKHRTFYDLVSDGLSSIGSPPQKQKYAPIVYGILITLTLLTWAIGREWTIAHPVLSPCSDTGCAVQVIYRKPELTWSQKIDLWANKYSESFTNNRWIQLRTKALLHYLLLREQAYGGSNNCGDSGLACGPLQFHESTYVGYRTTMIKQGLVKDLGSRLDMEDAIQTTAWAIVNGHELAWGPVYRGEIKL